MSIWISAFVLCLAALLVFCLVDDAKRPKLSHIAIVVFGAALIAVLIRAPTSFWVDAGSGEPRQMGR